MTALLGNMNSFWPVKMLMGNLHVSMLILAVPPAKPG